MKAKREGSKTFGADSTSWYNWATFDPEVSDNEILHSQYVMPEGCDGPGQSFAHRPTIRRSPTRVLLTQHCGFDV